MQTIPILVFKHCNQLEYYFVTMYACDQNCFNDDRYLNN